MEILKTKSSDAPQDIAVIGSGISGMAAAWLLAKNHRVTVYEKDDRPGGHSNTVFVENGDESIPVDTGFIVYNERNYPNLTALFDHLQVETKETDMSFGASLDDGGFEYAGTGLAGLFAQPRNLLRPRMWSLLNDLRRFYKEARVDVRKPEHCTQSLGEYLNDRGYGPAFVRDHLLPMGAAIWSTPEQLMLDYPLSAFVRFCDNHGLMSYTNRPVWRTVVGGSRRYVTKLTADYKDRIRLNTSVRSIRRVPDKVIIEDRQGGRYGYDHVVMACHADQALTMLADADAVEKRLLGKFRYERNLAILHDDPALMPRSRRAWSSWNFIGSRSGEQQKVCVTYWMNHLQSLQTDRQLFVSLNPIRSPQEGRVIRSFIYEHPLFDRDAIHAQGLLWNLQGKRRTWYCGAYFGHGFHEDGLQAGLAVAEQLGGMQRPWSLAEPSNRIHCAPLRSLHRQSERAA